MMSKQKYMLAQALYNNLSRKPPTLAVRNATIKSEDTD